MEAIVEGLYDPALPYHNYNHALDTLAAAENIILRCMSEGIRVDPQVIYYALLFHDAGYHENHVALGHESKEAYSAQLAEDHLNNAGVRPAIVRKVSAGIMSTHRYGSFVTADQKAIRAADLSGLAAPFEIFRKNTVALKDEYELLSGKTVEWTTWLTQITATIGFYLSQEIRLTSYFCDETGESAYHRAARDNLTRLLNE